MGACVCVCVCTIQVFGNIEKMKGRSVVCCLSIKNDVFDGKMGDESNEMQISN